MENVLVFHRLCSGMFTKQRDRYLNGLSLFRNNMYNLIIIQNCVQKISSIG